MNAICEQVTKYLARAHQALTAGELAFDHIEFAPGAELAERDLEHARSFLARIERALREMGVQL